MVICLYTFFIKRQLHINPSSPITLSTLYFCFFVSVCALLQLEKLHVSTTQIMKLGCKDAKVALYSKATKARSTMYSKAIL